MQYVFNLENSQVYAFDDGANYSALVPKALALTEAEFQAIKSNVEAGGPLSLDSDGKLICTLPPLSDAELRAACETALAEAIDALAKSWGYDSIVSAASYISSSVPLFLAEAQALIKYRDDVWLWARSELSAISAGTEARPGSVGEFVSGMPTPPVRPE